MINRHPVPSPPGVGRHGDGESAGMGREPALPADETIAATMTSMVTFLAGAWLAMAPFFRSYPDAGDGLGRYWNDVVTGLAVTVFALARAVSSRHRPWLTVPNVVLGAWLLLAPFVLAYDAGGGAVTNDVVVGLVVLLSSAAATVLSQHERAAGR